MVNAKTIYVPNCGKMEMNLGIRTPFRPTGVKHLDVDSINKGAWRSISQNRGYYLNEKGNKYLVLYNLNTKQFGFVIKRDSRGRIIYLSYE